MISNSANSQASKQLQRATSEKIKLIDKLVCWSPLVMPTVGEQKQKELNDPEFKTNLGYLVGTLSQKHQQNK